MSSVRKRRRRANPEQLYRTCRITGNCPPDIKNRFEQNTLADKILKYGSTAVYFGGLGIGTGSGRAGPGTIGRGGGISLGSATIPGRPDIPVETIGPENIVPVDAVDPLGPSIIPPERFPTAVEDPFTIRPPRFPSIVDEPLPPGGGVAGGAEVSTSGSAFGVDDPAVLLVQPEDTVTSRTHYDNPSFQVTVHAAGSGTAETSASDSILVTHPSGGVVIGGDTEFIPLREVMPLRPGGGDEVQETSFMTSTPRQVDTTSGRRVNLQSRRFQQVRVEDPAFLSRPSTLVQFDNPAFEEDVTLIFEQDIGSIAAAPHSDFTDIQTLSRPILERGRDGFLRVSRFGRRGTISTRSGVQIGAQVHFFYEVSEIQPIDTIELRTLGEQSMQSEIVTGADQGFDQISISESLPSSIPEADLLDDLNSTVGEGVRLIFFGGNDTDADIALPFNTDFTVRRPPHFYPGTDTGIHVYYPESTAGKGKVIPDDTPHIIIRVIGDSDDYDLHPSLLRRKRKRAYF